MNILLVPAELFDKVNKLSANTLRRCEQGLRAWEDGNYDLLLLTGGLFLPKSLQTRTAAEIMRDWFIDHGVDPDKIHVESASLDTYENISLGLVVLREAGISSPRVTVLTQYQHAIRFFLTFLLAHRRIVKCIPIRQPAMRWKDWLMEWLVLIPYHAIDWHGRLFLARHNRAQRTRDAQSHSAN